MTLTATPPTDFVDLSAIKTVKQVPYTEYFVSGHRTCQGCESALVMRYIAKAAGPRTIVMGSTGCMYVANTSYYTTPWVVPWMHTQLGSAGSAALGAAAGLKVLMRKGKLADEPINVIAFCGDGGGADMGLSAISAALTHAEYRFLIILYDNESYANTDIQVSGSSPYGAVTTFSPSGKKKRIMHTRWKKNTPGMLAAGGPAFIHTLDPCPKGWHYDPQLSHELGKLAVETGIWSLWEMEDHTVKLNGTTRSIATGRAKRKPVREYLSQQGRFAHFIDEDYDFFQRRVDEQWNDWLIPGVVSFAIEPGTPLNQKSNATAPVVDAPILETV